MSAPTVAPPLMVNPGPPRAPFPGAPVAPQSAPPIATSSPPPVFRGQAPEEPLLRPVATPGPVPAIPPAPPLLGLPSPTQLGIARPAGKDGADAWTRLDRLGVTCFRVDRSGAGGYRVTCVVAGTQANRDRRFEGEAASQAEAVRLVLDQAEAWAASK